jgi:hypothetical protein
MNMPMFFSDNFISGARFDSDIYESEYMDNVRKMLKSVQIVDHEYPTYDNTYEGYDDVWIKYHERMPFIFENDNIKNFVVHTKCELLQIWNFTFQNYDSLYEYFDNYQERFIECCPVKLKCEVLRTVTDEYYVLDRFRVMFEYDNKDLMQKLMFYSLIKYI